MRGSLRVFCSIDIKKEMVPGAGLEPARCYQRGILNHHIIYIKIKILHVFFKINNTSESLITTLKIERYYEGF
ncbi:hypothetical protein KUL42_32430 [Alteromonas sp. KUL42]|nr:hypothetical protein KUL42_32430 [Alteromonas sp. KUL42]